MIYHVTVFTILDYLSVEELGVRWDSSGNGAAASVIGTGVEDVVFSLTTDDLYAC